MKNLSQQELVTMLSNQKGATTISLATVTIPAMNKTGNPFYGRVEKLTVASVLINFIYANSVNKKRENEAAEEGTTAETFVPHARKWGQRILGTPLVENKGKFYVEARFATQAESEAMGFRTKPTSIYFVDGQEVDKSVLGAWIKTPNSNAEHQGVEKENEIIVRDYAVENIKEIKINKEHYKIS